MPAKSLVCGVCKAELKSVKAATEHAELTGHADFAESTAPVVTMKCRACGKPCDSKEEQDLHTRHTGHGDYDTVESDLVAVGGIPSAADAAPTLDPEALRQLLDMGFPEVRAEKALVRCGAGTLEAAIEWLAAHGEDPDIDVPLEIKPVAAVPKAPLTEEEKKQRAKELQARLKAQRDQQAEAEKKKELDLEKRRREFGKQALEAIELQRQQEVRNEEYLRKRQKEADALAKAKVLEGLRKDRAERGLAVRDQTEAEKKEQEMAEVQRLRQQFKDLFAVVKAAGDPVAKVAAETMALYINNVLKNPDEPKYRKVKLSNAAFQSRVAAVPGTLDYLAHAGFVPSGECLEAAAPDHIRLQAAATELQVQLLFL